MSGLVWLLLGVALGAALVVVVWQLRARTARKVTSRRAGAFASTARTARESTVSERAAVKWPSHDGVFVERQRVAKRVAEAAPGGPAPVEKPPLTTVLPAAELPKPLLPPVSTPAAMEPLVEAPGTSLRAGKPVPETGLEASRAVVRMPEGLTESLGETLAVAGSTGDGPIGAERSRAWIEESRRRLRRELEEPFLTLEELETSLRYGAVRIRIGEARTRLSMKALEGRAADGPEVSVECRPEGLSPTASGHFGTEAAGKIDSMLTEESALAESNRSRSMKSALIQGVGQTGCDAGKWFGKSSVGESLHARAQRSRRPSVRAARSRSATNDIVPPPRRSVRRKDDS